MANYGRHNLFFTSWIVLCLVVVPAVMSQVMLTRDKTVCLGKTIILNCTTTGSSTLRWESIEYFGPSSQIEYRSFESVGTTKSIQDAVANLTANENVGGMRVLTSMLRITARSTIPNFSITCINGDLGSMNTSTFNVTAVSGAPENVRAAEISERIDNSCIILVTWSPPAGSNGSDIDHYIVYIPSRNITNMESSAITVLRVPSCHDNDSILVAAVNRFGCEGMNSSEIQPILFPNPPITEIGSTTVTPTGDGPTPTTFTAAAVVGAILFTLLLISTTIFIIMFFVCYKRGKEKAEKDILRKLRESEELPEQGDAVAEYERRSSINDFESALKDFKVVQATVWETVVDEIQDDLKGLYDALNSQPVNKIRVAAKSLSKTLEKASSKPDYIIKEALLTTLELLVYESGKDIQTVLDRMKSMITDVGSIDQKFEARVNRLYTEAGKDQHKEILVALIEEVDGEEVQPDQIIVVLLKLCKKLQEKSQESKKTEKMYRFSGQWKGYYKQYGEKQKMPCTLIIDRDDNIAGRGEDISRFSISGKIEPDGTFKFNKQYEGPTQFHMVIYCGSVEWADQPVVRGKWNIDSIGDKFLLTVDNVGLEASVITLCYSSAKEVLDMDRNQKRRKIINELSEKISEDLSDEDLIKVVEAQSKVQTASELSPSYGISGGGEEYAMGDKSKKSYSSGVYQDPHHIDRETMPATGDLYAVSEKKPKKGSKKGPSDEELVPMYSIPDKSKRDQELTYAAIEVHGGAGGVHGGASSEYATIID